MKEALFYKKLPDKNVKCVLCPRLCVLKDGQTGYCRTRKNIGGRLFSIVYGRVCAFNTDPIEKKPFFHFALGSSCLSIGTTGCNLRCMFCQNFDISTSDKVFGQEMEPEQVVEFAVKEGLPGIAYTYNEPTVFYEFCLDTMKLAKKAKLYNVWVSNGYTNPEPIKKASKYLDAINIDIKGGMKFYQKLCSVPDEKPMRRALKEYKKHGVWIEVTNLMIPGHNDKPAQVKSLVGWVKANLGVNTPIHFTRFHPYHRMTSTSPTPLSTLEKAHTIARKQGMKWVYIGNVPGHEYESTYCPRCGELLVRRIGFGLGSYTEKCRCGQKLVLAGKKWSGIINVPRL